MRESLDAYFSLSVVGLPRELHDLIKKSACGSVDITIGLNVMLLLTLDLRNLY